MKTLSEVQAEERYADFFTLEQFCELLDSGSITSRDGWGYFHDGEKRTKYEVFDDTLTWDDVKDFPYVVWVNK